MVYGVLFVSTLALANGFAFGGGRLRDVLFVWAARRLPQQALIEPDVVL